MPLTEPTRLVLAKTYVGVDDPDAAAYIAAVEAADEAASPGVGALETATKVAIHSFVKGCKADGIWPAIKASCILAGARTLNGALVPLAGTAPTNFNFVAGDYNRKTGLVGNSSSKYLNSNITGTAAPQDSYHLSVFPTSLNSTTPGMISDREVTTSSHQTTITTIQVTNRGAAGTARAPVNNSIFGTSRNGPNSWSVRAGGVSYGETAASTGVSTNSVKVFVRGDVQFFSDSRLAFYSIGESLNLALLDARVTDLINAFGAAIP